MDKEQKDIEIKKLEIEKAKILEGYFRTLAFMLLSIGAGIGTVSKILKISQDWWMYIISILGFTFILIALAFLSVWQKLNKKIKEMEKWK